MVTERRIHEAQTFLNKKGTGYVIDIASPEERQYFEGIIYDKGVASFDFINHLILSSHSLNSN